MTTNSIDFQKCAKCGIDRNLSVCLSCNLVFCDYMEEDHIFSHFISTQHCYGMTLKKKKKFDLSFDSCDKNFIEEKNCGQVLNDSFDHLVLNTNNNNNHPLTIDNESKRIVEEVKLINVHLNKSLDELRNENNKLLTSIDSLLQEKEEQSKHISEIKDYLANERLTNQKLVKQLNKNREGLTKLQHDFDEEKAINQQLFDNQHQLTNEMKEKKKEIKELKEQMNDLILHITGADKIKSEATEDELNASEIIITSKPSKGRRRK